MQTRPSVVYVRRRCVKRKTLRCVLLFILIDALLLCFEMRFLTSLIAALILVALVRTLWWK